MRRDTKLLRWVGLSALALAVALAAWIAVSALLIGSTMPADERDTLWALLGPRLPLLVLSGALLVAAGAAAVQAAYQRWIAAPARLLEQARAQLTAERPAPLKPQGAGDATLRELAIVVDALLQNRRRLRDDVAQQVAVGSRRVEQERARLAALMSELTQSVVVCNLDGRVLLYNNRARLQFKALSEAPQLAGGAELIGLGRSIYAVFDRQLVAHALDNIRQRLARGATAPSAQFVTVTKSGQLLRAQMAAVRDLGEGGDGADGGDGSGAPLGGFVLLLDNITRDYERDAAQDTLLLGLTEGQRASLGNLQAAVELLDDPALDAPTRDRFLAVIRDEARRMSARLQDLASRSAEGLKTRWPLEEMLGSEFVGAALRRLGTLGVRSGTLEVDPALWLKVDSFALLQALATLGERLVDEFQVKALLLRLQAVDGRAQLDLVWTGQAMSTETVMTWESEPMKSAGSASALSVRDVMQRHGGEFWFERDRARHQAFFRFLLPLADSELDAEPEPHAESRPEYYDFDLFAAAESHHALDDRRLAELTYTVFDTETTGLRPADGDEIIQIGAARIVNGKLLRQESFEQLVDPRRGIPEAGIPIHGIRPEMVRGQPTIEQVLPAFHTYARDTVLVAHNAAFDMRFLQLKEAACGLRFDQPVLDTLLLSAVVHPNQESHRLEHIAERFGITVVGRHTALGDAMVTAEVFLKLVPLLAAMGIHTLAEARAAAQKTWYARLKY